MDFLSIFEKKKKPLLKSERYYEQEEENVNKKYLKFPFFVAVGLILVVAVIVIMFVVNIDNNPLKMFNKASAKLLDCSGFSYEVSAGKNGETYMYYQGAMELDVENQTLESSYHAVYDNYEYDATVYAKGIEAYRGNYFDGKWSVEDYSQKSLDFFDFYRDYRKGDFDAGAALRFTGMNDVFSAPNLEESFEKISKELTSPSGLNKILCSEVRTENDVTVVTFNPNVKELFGVITRNIGSAYASAKAYTEFKESVDYSADNLEKAQLTLSYTIDGNGYLTDILFNYTIGNDNYVIEVHTSDFENADAEISQGFLTAAGIDN